MHQYKTIVQTLLVLSILNLVYAAPAVPQEVRDTGNDVVVVAEDVTTGSDRRRDVPLAPDGSPPQDSEPSSGPAPSPHLSATDGQVPVPVHDSTAEASTSAHPLSVADGPAPVPVSNTEASTSSHQPVPVHDSTAEGSTSPHYTVVTYDMLDKDPPSKKVLAAKKVAGFTLLFGTVAAVVLFSALHHNHNNQTGGG
jgi:hypothetical protein